MTPSSSDHPRFVAPLRGNPSRRQFLGAVGAAAATSITGCLGTTAQGECEAGKGVSRLRYRGVTVVPEGTPTEADSEALTAAIGPGALVSMGEQLQDAGPTERAYLVRGAVGREEVRTACSEVGIAISSIEQLDPGPPEPAEVAPKRRSILDDAGVTLPEFTTYEGADGGFITFPDDVTTRERRIAETVVTQMGLLQVTLASDDRVTLHRHELTPGEWPALRQTSEGRYHVVTKPHQYPFDTWTDGAFSERPSEYTVRWYADGRRVGERTFSSDEVRSVTNGGVRFGDSVTVSLTPDTTAAAAAIYAATSHSLFTALRAERLC